MLNTLQYLKRGGRITPAAAAIGSLLHIKPVLQIKGEARRILQGPHGSAGQEHHAAGDEEGH